MFLTEADAKAVFKRLELVCPEEKKDNHFFDNCSIIKKKEKKKMNLAPALYAHFQFFICLTPCC